ncbi:DUF2490 domain-containing protein [Flavobacterium psychrotolerans]|uniref:DUF2490 domain-containing protein n=1 Tax=Flavobacterium psychrotolerans TaxID=2169410 RepID=A0A2U1JJL8_9FLAO|nr:DUF2490 domain-containing protein [Flavobacterium psychrotolerans]PWA05332.1 hypothetical protein DB895_06940 [Flavobacterium psychrotolerans]
MFRNALKIFVILFPLLVLGQVHSEKEIKNQTQSWFSLNNNLKFNDHWSLLADFHIRRNNFVSDDSFYFVRGGLSYMPNSKVSFALGYGHMWVAPSKPEWNTFSDENRIYQQTQLSTKIGEVGILQRIRNEQRWQEKIVNDEPTGINRFTDRVRYLLSVNIPVFKKKNMPSLVIADEILIHFGKEVVFNTLDQNRIFIGIKQAINPKLSFDFGYMNVYQQKYSGYQYDSNHTLRLFFYYNNSIKSLTHFGNHESGD